MVAGMRIATQMSESWCRVYGVMGPRGKAILPAMPHTACVNRARDFIPVGDGARRKDAQGNKSVWHPRCNGDLIGINLTTLGLRSMWRWLSEMPLSYPAI
jgi:hypothetical protein